MFSAFEKLVQTYPEAEPGTPPKGLLAFVWYCTQGMRPFIVTMTLATAVIGAFEALLFSMLGKVVDWLGQVAPGRLWAEHGSTLALLAGVLAGSLLLIALQSLLKQQTLAGNFPMRLRWNFHRLMLGQMLAERLPGADVGQRHVQRPSRRPQPAHAVRQPGGAEPCLHQGEPLADAAQYTIL